MYETDIFIRDFRVVTKEIRLVSHTEHVHIKYAGYVCVHACVRACALACCLMCLCVL